MSGYAWLTLIPLLNIPIIYYCCHLPMNYVFDGKMDRDGKIIRLILLLLVAWPIIGGIIWGLISMFTR